MLRRSAFTLIELTVALAIIAALSAIVVPVFSETLSTSRNKTTRSTLAVLRTAVLDYWEDTKHLPMDGVTTAATETNRVELTWLFKNPTSGDETVDFDSNSKIGWRGRYVATSTGDEVTAGAAYLIDAWNNELTIQDPNPSTSPRDIRIVSAGPNGSVDIPSGTPTASLTAADLGDDEYVALSLR